MTEPAALFAEPTEPRPCPGPRFEAGTDGHSPSLSGARVRIDPAPDERLLEVYSRARDPEDPFELRDLYLGRIEHELGCRSTRTGLAELWRAARPRRAVDAGTVLGSRATVRFVKEMFNTYFRDDLYGEFRRPGQLILSGGAVDEEEWGLPATIKDCISYALARDWYGYSDSRGREPAREAIAAYESSRLSGARYSLDNIAITMGGTFAVSCLADFILTDRATSAPALCAIPNYPPLVESIARRADVELVPTPSTDGTTSIQALLDRLRPETPLVLLQTASNPTGALVDEAELERLIAAASPSTMILLDECHEWLGPVAPWSNARAADNVIRISSLSKNWSAPGLKVGWIVAAESLIADYYEFSSTSYGGPSSFFYTAVEAIARMERWRHDQVKDLDAGHAGEFEPSYGLTLPNLQRAYDRYRSERDRREESLIAFRDVTTARLEQAGIAVAAARYSINLAMDFQTYDDSYRCFRDLLDAEDVSVFPGLLTFCLSRGIVRVTTARRWSELGPALDRIDRFRRPVQSGANGSRPRS